MPVDRRVKPDRRRTITVVTVDSQPIIRDMLARILTEAGLDVIGEAGTAEHGIELVLELGPDVVVMDIALPGMSGVEATAQLGLLAPAARVLILTGSDQNSVVGAIVSGASGYIVKGAQTDEIVAAVIATAAGQAVLSPQIAGKLLQRIREIDTSAATASRTATAIRAALTERELQVFTLLASGKSNQEIGTALFLSTNTVSNHMTSILAKLQLHNRIQAAVHAVRAGFA